MRAQERTRAKKAYLQSLGIEVVTMHECQFKRNIKPKIKHIIDRYLPSTFVQGKRFASDSAIIKAIMGDKLFGSLYCDIEVPDEWDTKKDSFRHELSPKEYFSEMSPIFCVSDVEAKDFGAHMTEFCQQSKFFPKKTSPLDWRSESTAYHAVDFTCKVVHIARFENYKNLSICPIHAAKVF